MELVMDEKGNVVLQDGLPVYKYEDGTEMAFDAKKTLSNYDKKIADLTEERTRHFTTAEKLKTDLKVFKDIDPAKAKEALETVANLKSKELLDANGIKVLKSEMVKGFESEKSEIKKGYDLEIDKIKKQVSEKEGVIRNLLITTQFSNSPHFSGKDQKTIYCAEDAVKIFGDRFTVNDKLEVLGLTKNGEVMMSQKSHGDPASFEEAISRMLDEHPRKASILAQHPGGIPGRGNLGPGKEGEYATTQQQIAAGLKHMYPHDFER